MKRGKPPKRSTPMKRSGRLARVGITRRTPLKRVPFRRKPPKPKPAEGPLTADGWRQAITVRELARTRARVHPAVTSPQSQLSGVPIPLAMLRPANFHHVVPKSWLRREGLHDRVWDPRNGMLLTEAEHAHHEDGTARIPRSAIPFEAEAFIFELPASVHRFLEPKYPDTPEGGS